MRGDFLSRKSILTAGEEILPKNLNKWFVGEDIILPLIMPLCRETRDTGDTGNFLRRKFPEPFKEFAARLWQ